MRSFVFVCSVFVYASTSVHLEKIEVCYGSLFFIRYNIWKKHLGRKNLTKPVALKSLPPSNSSLELNILRAHFQASIWKSALQPQPPDLCPLKVGYNVKDMY